MTELPSNSSNPEGPVGTLRQRSRRLGCWIGLLLWLMLLLLPCAAIVLISQGEIAIQLGELPGQSFRIWLIQDAKERGIGFASPSMLKTKDGLTCLQTNTNFFLWMGKGESSAYCDCFVSTAAGWQLTSTTSGLCNP